MTLNEAIEHAEERACGNDQCAKDHAQLADWLRELRRTRMEVDLLKTLRDGFKADAQKYKAENAKLKESLERAAGIIVDICGECPASRYEWLSSDGCAEKCGTVTEEECWIAYLTGKRWDESGAEVN